MPARIVVILNKRQIAEDAASALRARGQDALALSDPMTALEALEGAERIEVLVTSLDFAPGKPNGIALGRMARLKRPGIRVLFVGPTDLEQFAEGLGIFMPAPVTGPQVVEGVLQTLDIIPDIRLTITRADAMHSCEPPGDPRDLQSDANGDCLRSDRTRFA